MNKVLLLSGTCGSGKTTISKLIAEQENWERICEDDIWLKLFGKDRGNPRLPGGERKRAKVYEIVFDKIHECGEHEKNVVIDLTVHEAPPDAFLEYKEFFEANGIPFEIRILHPRLEVAVSRDSRRRCWNVGAERVKQLRAKYTVEIFGEENFIDNSDESPEETFEKHFRDLQ
jgi:predicted kinase